MSVSYELGFPAPQYIHNVTKLKLKKGYLWFWGADDEVEFVSPAVNYQYVKRVPDSTEAAGEDVVEVRNAYSNNQQVLTTISGVKKIDVEWVDEFGVPVYVLCSDDDDLPAGVAPAGGRSANRLGRGPQTP
jgi:hypothetical protein